MYSRSSSRKKLLSELKKPWLPSARTDCPAPPRRRPACSRTACQALPLPQPPAKNRVLVQRKVQKCSFLFIAPSGGRRLHGDGAGGPETFLAFP